MKYRILVVDDDKDILLYLRTYLTKAGYETYLAENVGEALNILKNQDINIVISDLHMPKVSGLQLLKRIQDHYPDTLVMIMTAYATIETAVEAMKNGAYDYLAKPISKDELLLKLERIKELKNQQIENMRLRRQLESHYRFGNIIGKSKPMRDVFEKIRMVTDSDATVIIQGASGTGKELVAGAIHYNSPRAHKPFITVHCGIFNQGILESELFGHEKGAFTGAMRQKMGRFEMAHGGSIFLDDVDDIPIETQVKLLRVLQERKFERIGGERTIAVDVRVIAATKKDLKKLVQEQKFREDLYFRLKVIPILLPPLKERGDDIPLLIRHFIKKYDREGRINPDKISPEVLKFARSYDWPGNVRELEHAVEHAVIFCRGKVLKVEHFPEDIIHSQMQQDLINPVFHDGPVKINEMLRVFERKMLQWAWDKSAGNQSEMAKLLSVPRTTLRDKLLRHKFIEEKSSKMRS